MQSLFPFIGEEKFWRESWVNNNNSLGLKTFVGGARAPGTNTLPDTRLTLLFFIALTVIIHTLANIWFTPRCANSYTHAYRCWDLPLNDVWFLSENPRAEGLTLSRSVNTLPNDSRLRMGSCFSCWGCYAVFLRHSFRNLALTVQQWSETIDQQVALNLSIKLFSLKYQLINLFTHPYV